jgi:hypothetical protein
VITSTLLVLCLSTLTGLLNIAPVAAIDVSGLAVNVSTVAGLAGTLNGYFPLVTLGVCLGIVFGLKVFMLGYRLVLFVWHQFWGAS